MSREIASGTIQNQNAPFEGQRETARNRRTRAKRQDEFLYLPRISPIIELLY